MLFATRLFLAALLGLFVHLGAVSAQPQFPDRPVRIIVPFGPGGGTDTMARVVSKKLADIWGQPVVIENKGGAQGNIGAALGAAASPDGYTLTLIIHSSTTINPHVFKSIGYDVFDDLKPVGRATEAPYVLAVNASLPAKDLKEFISLSKSKPGTFNYGTSAVGPQLAGELFLSTTGADLLHVPYNGAGQAATALLSNDIHALISTPVAVMPHVQSGQVRVVGVFGNERFDGLPDVPTAIEQGFPELKDISEWYGFAVPAKTPDEIVQVLNDGLVLAMKDPEVQASIRTQGLTPAPSTPQELAQRIKSDYDRWAAVVKETGFKLE